MTFSPDDLKVSFNWDARRAALRRRIAWCEDFLSSVVDGQDNGPVLKRLLESAPDGCCRTRASMMLGKIVDSPSTMRAWIQSWMRQTKAALEDLEDL